MLRVALAKEYSTLVSEYGKPGSEERKKHIARRLYQLSIITAELENCWPGIEMDQDSLEDKKPLYSSNGISIYFEPSMRKLRFEEQDELV